MSCDEPTSCADGSLNDSKNVYSDNTTEDKLTLNNCDNGLTVRQSCAASGETSECSDTHSVEQSCTDGSKSDSCETRLTDETEVKGNDGAIREQQIEHVEQSISKDDKAPTREVTQESNSNQCNNSDDPELDSLLDDALQDFDKVIPNVTAPTSTPAATSFTTNAAGQSGAATGGTASQSQEDMFNEVFSMLANQSGDDRKALESIFKSLTLGQPGGEAASTNSQSGSSSAASAATAASQTSGGVGSSAEAGGGSLWDTLQHTLNNLATDEQGLESNELSDEDFMRLMTSLAGGEGGAGAAGLAGMADLFGGMGGGGEGEAELMPLMQGMMKNLLSRDVLYPSLKEICNQYPAWLQANKGVVETEAYNKYEKQYGLMALIVREYEEERDSDSEEVKTQRFQRIFEAMQSMQELGHPPKEIVGEVPPGMDFGASGLPSMFSGAGNPDQCPVM